MIEEEEIDAWTPRITIFGYWWIALIPKINLIHSITIVGYGSCFILIYLRLVFNFVLESLISLISVLNSVILFLQFSKISSLFNLQFLHEIKVKFIDFWFCGFVFKSSFIKYHFSQFLSPIHHPIRSNLKRSSRISLIPYGFDPYLPLYPSIQINYIKLVSLNFILTWDCVFSKTSRSRSVNHPSPRCCWCHRSKDHKHNFDMNQLDW